MTLFRFLAIALAGLVAALGSGCSTPPPNDPVRIGPFFVPTNVARDVTLGGIRRVVLLPICGGEVASDESAAALDPVFRQALQDENRFEIVTLSRTECQRRFGVPSLSSASALPHDFFPTLQQVYAADAVLFIDLTVYHPYHPIAIGIRGRLATINALRQVWSFDCIYSATDPRVAASARHFFLGSEHQGVPGDLTPAVLQSPGRFAAYAAAATFATLPPVTLGN